MQELPVNPIPIEQPPVPELSTASFEPTKKKTNLSVIISMILIVTSGFFFYKGYGESRVERNQVDLFPLDTYACYPGGDCRDFIDASLACPKTYTDEECNNECSSPDLRCYFF